MKTTMSVITDIFSSKYKDLFLDKERVVLEQMLASARNEVISATATRPWSISEDAVLDLFVYSHSILALIDFVIFYFTQNKTGVIRNPLCRATPSSDPVDRSEAPRMIEDAIKFLSKTDFKHRSLLSTIQGNCLLLMMEVLENSNK